MRLTALRPVQSWEIKITFTRWPRKEENGDWSMGVNIIPYEAITMCVGYTMWLKPYSIVNKRFVYNHANQEELVVTFPDNTGLQRSFIVALADLDRVDETMTTKFGEYSLQGLQLR